MLRRTFVSLVGIFMLLPRASKKPPIHCDPFRKKPENVRFLKQMIAYKGFCNPLILGNDNGDLYLLSGYRRLQAARELGLETVTCRYLGKIEKHEIEVSRFV